MFAGNLPDLMPVIDRFGRSGFWRSADVYTYTAEGNVKNIPADLDVYAADGTTLLDGP